MSCARGRTYGKELRGHVVRNAALYAGQANAQAADVPQNVQAVEAAQRHLDLRIRTAHVASAAEVAAAAAFISPAVAVGGRRRERQWR